MTLEEKVLLKAQEYRAKAKSLREDTLVSMAEGVHNVLWSDRLV